MLTKAQLTVARGDLAGGALDCVVEVDRLGRTKGVRDPAQHVRFLVPLTGRVLLHPHLAWLQVDDEASSTCARTQ
jgi:hypothetical protein